MLPILVVAINVWVELYVTVSLYSFESKQLMHLLFSSVALSWYVSSKHI